MWSSPPPTNISKLHVYARIVLKFSCKVTRNWQENAYTTTIRLQERHLHNWVELEGKTLGCDLYPLEGTKRKKEITQADAYLLGKEGKTHRPGIPILGSYME